MVIPEDLQRVELRCAVRSQTAGSRNPDIDAGAIAKTIHAGWTEGTYRLCIVVEESPKPEQVGLVAVVQAGMVRVPRGETTT